jgi:hypothetical protein
MRVTVLLLVMIAAACASEPRESSPATPRTVRIIDGTGHVTQISTDASSSASAVTMELTPDQAWRGLLAAYDALGIPVASMDAGTRFLGANVRTRGRLGGVRLSTYLDCGRTQGGPSADTYDVHLVVETRLQPGELETTRVSTLIEATARPSSFAAAPVRCSSTGALERRILAEIRTHVWPDLSR